LFCALLFVAVICVSSLEDKDSSTEVNVPSDGSNFAKSSVSDHPVSVRRIVSETVIVSANAKTGRHISPAIAIIIANFFIAFLLISVGSGIFAFNEQKKPDCQFTAAWQPGYLLILKEIRGFPSPPRGGFGFYQSLKHL
jgi:hypothetical protein